jgi:hypothetical protein
MTRRCILRLFDPALRVYNDKISFTLNKTAGAIQRLTYKGTELLGASGEAYFDCYCVPADKTAGKPTILLLLMLRQADERSDEPSLLDLVSASTCSAYSGEPKSTSISKTLRCWAGL